jgi:hypothetical protein
LHLGSEPPTPELEISPGTRFGTRGSEVQILSPRPFIINNLRSARGLLIHPYVDDFVACRPREHFGQILGSGIPPSLTVPKRLLFCEILK